MIVRRPPGRGSHLSKRIPAFLGMLIFGLLQASVNISYAATASSSSVAL